MEIAEREAEILKFWQQKKIFEQSLKARKGNRRFVFYDGPPFATGLPHYGHILASVIKDAIPRYQTMRGRYVERRWGWDCHGLPMENLVEVELGLKTRRDIETYGIEQFNRYAQEQVLRYADDWKRIIPRIGRWADMEHDYKTMDWSYSETIWWIFKTLHDKKLIYEGYKSMHICPRCETPLANFEVTQGYKDVKDHSVYVKFELEDEPGTYVLAWTTTPWTLPGNVALAVNAETNYIKIHVSRREISQQINSQKDSAQIPEGSYIVARDREYEVRKSEMGFGGRIEKEFKGADLVGRKYKPIFDYYANDPKLKNRENGWKIYPADFVTTDEGTGIVHIAPAFGEEDMNLGKKLDLPFIQHIGIDGKFKPEVRDFAGLPAKPKGDPQSTDKNIIAHLRASDVLFAEREIEHSYPHCWRCDTPLLNYAAKSWFVNVVAIKQTLVANNKKVTWVPKHIRDGRFGRWLEGARDWAISRTRYWGAPIPVWQCEACATQEVIGSIDELWKRAGGAKYAPKDAFLRDDKGGINLHRPYIDAVTLSCVCGGMMRRVPEVFDCWFESGSMPYGQHHYMGKPLKEFDPQKGVGFPADFIAEGLDQTRGWFYSLLVIGTALFGKLPFRAVIVNGTILAEDGQKMSKRLKNYPDPMEVVERYGADAVRMYLLGAPVVYGEDLNFSVKGVDEIYKKYTLIATNVLNFFELYKPLLKKRPARVPKPTVLDQWILSRLSSTTTAVTKALDAYMIADAVRPLADVMQDLSLWYVRRSRERIKAGGTEAYAAIKTLQLVISDFARLSAPIAPFLAETLYRGASLGKKASVHLEDWPTGKKGAIKKALERDMAAVRGIVSEALRLRSEAGIKVRQPLRELCINDGRLKGKKALLAILADEVNIKQVRVDARLGSAVELDTTITEALREEGEVRKLVRAVQNARKAKGLHPRQVAKLGLGGLDTEFLERWRAEIEQSTHTRVSASVASGPGERVEINGKTVTLALV